MEQVGNKQGMKIEADHKRNTNGEIRLYDAIVVFVVMLGVLFVIGAATVPGAFFPAEALKKGVTTVEIGWIFGILELASFIIVVSPLYGVVIGRAGVKFTCNSALFACGVSTILFGIVYLAPNGAPFVATCLIIRIFQGFSQGIYISTAISVLTTTYKSRTNLMSVVVSSGESLGMILAPPIGGFLYQTWGFPFPFISMGSSMVILSLAQMFVLPTVAVIGKPSLSHIGMLLRIPAVGPLVTLTVIGVLDATAFVPILQLHLHNHGFSAKYVGLVFMSMALSSTLGAFVVAYIGDKKPHVVPSLLGAGFILAGISMWFTGPAQFFPKVMFQWWTTLIAMVIQGMSVSPVLIQVAEMIREAKSASVSDDICLYAVVSSIATGAESLGAFLGPMLSGTLNAAVGFGWTFASLGSVTFTFGIIYLLFNIKRKHFQDKNGYSSIM